MSETANFVNKEDMKVAALERYHPHTIADEKSFNRLNVDCA